MFNVWWLTHQTRNRTCRKVIAITPDDLQRRIPFRLRSVSVKSPLKMAIQYWNTQGKTDKATLRFPKKWLIMANTCAAMSVCDPEKWQPMYLSRTHSTVFSSHHHQLAFMSQSKTAYLDERLKETFATASISTLQDSSLSLLCKMRRMRFLIRNT